MQPMSAHAKTTSVMIGDNSIEYSAANQLRFVYLKLSIKQMTVAIPRTKAVELVSQLSQLCQAQDPIDEITSRRLRREIEQSKGVDARNAFIARGMLAMLEWDLPGIHSSFEAALPLGDATTALESYATCLQMIGDYANAANIIQRAYDRARTDLRLLRKAINFCYLAAHFSCAKELCDMYDKLCPSEPHPEGRSIEQALEVLEMGGLNEQLAAQCNRIAFDLLRERQVVFLETSSEGDLLDGIMLMDIIVKADQQTVELLDAELGERLFDEVAGYNPSCYWIGYKSGLDIETPVVDEEGCL